MAVKIVPNSANATVRPRVAFVAVLHLNIVTSVESSLTTMLAPFRPTNAINSPIPAEIESRRLAGIALKIASRTLVRLKIIKMIPSTKTAAKATCQLYPILMQTV